MVAKSLKSIWFWLVTLPIIYMASGFFLLPWLIQSYTPSFLKEKYHLNVTLGAITFNPLTYELHLSNAILKTDAQEPVISLKHFYIDYSPLGLFKKEIIIKTVLLEEPFIDFQLDTTGAFNLIKLFSAFISSEEEVTSDTSSNELPLTIKHFEINGAKGKFTDFRLSSPFIYEFGPLQYTINNLSFDKDSLSIHALKLALQNQDKITLASSVTFDPLKIHGQVDINHLPLPSLWGYFLPTIPAQLSQGEVSTTLPFTLDLSKELPQLAIEKASLSFEKLVFITPTKQPLIACSSLTLDSIDISWPQATIALGKLSLINPAVHMSLEKGYEPDLKRWFMPSSTQKQHPSQDDNTTAWNVILQNLLIEQGIVELIDTNTRRSKTTLSDIALKIDNLSNDTNRSISYDLMMQLDKSPLALKGTFYPKQEKLETSLMAKALPLVKLQPYLETYTPLTLSKGLLSTKATLSLSLQKTVSLLFKGDVTIDALTFQDAFKKPLISWDLLSLDEVIFNTTPSSLQIKKITLTKPYINLDIRKDKRTNFTDIIKPSSSSLSTHTSTKEEDMEVRIGDVTLKNGSANFKDASLPIPFATLIHNLNGTFSTLDTKNTKPSVLKLEGKVDKYGYAKISGSLLPFDFKDRANLKILFKNIDMPSLTPYSGKFIGYAIQKGKLSMDLSYKIKKGLMEGDNKINLDSLTLGEKIESEDATNLPLGLAIAILKDSKGQIDIDLPVSGDLNDPDFKYGALVWKAVGNLLGSIITSPFSLIGSLLGIETETLKSVDFAAGDFELVASEEEKIEQYKQILEKKPELKLSITPSYNETLDTAGLQERAVDANIEAMTKNAKQGEDSYTKALKELFIKRTSKDAYYEFIATLEEQKLERGAMNEALKSKIATTFKIEPQDLERLAQQRADAIVTLLSKKYTVPTTKIIKNSVQPSDAIREKWIGCTVSVSN